MNNVRKHITVYEYQSLKVGETYNNVVFEKTHLNQFQNFYGNKGVPYFVLINKGVKFKEFVGVIQIGNLSVEVLPKTDKNSTNLDWQGRLIGMMRAVGAFDIKAPSTSSLNIKSNFILDLYFELFLTEVEYLFHKGLIKKYRKIQANNFALRGNILFGKHIQQNLVHQERFYIRHSAYDKIHILHQVLYETLKLLSRINSNDQLKSRIGNLLLNFPEMDNLKVTEDTFKKLVLNRKTEGYNNAISISKLILLKYHPDVNKGQNDVLALMFDMNMLWEKFIYVSLRKFIPDQYAITAQTYKDFWVSDDKKLSRMKPDIVINQNNSKAFVLDTKWKNIGDDIPAPADLRQLYVYHEYYNAEKVALVYPGNENINSGKYFIADVNKHTKKECSLIEIPSKKSIKECSIIKIPSKKSILDWQKKIADQVFADWLEIESYERFFNKEKAQLN